MSHRWHPSGQCSRIHRSDRILPNPIGTKVGRRIILENLVYKYPLEASNAKAEADQASQDRDDADLFRVEAAGQSLCLQAHAASSSEACYAVHAHVLSRGLWHVLLSREPFQGCSGAQLGGRVGKRLQSCFRHIQAYILQPSSPLEGLELSPSSLLLIRKPKEKKRDSQNSYSSIIKLDSKDFNLSGLDPYQKGR